LIFTHNLFLIGKVLAFLLVFGRKYKSMGDFQMQKPGLKNWLIVTLAVIIVPAFVLVILPI